MKKILCLMVGVLLALAVFAVAGCGGSSQTSAESESKSNTSGSTAGVPVYPGASKVDISDAGGPPGMDSSRPQPTDGSMPGPGNGTPPTTTGATPPGGSTAPGPMGSGPGMGGQNPGSTNGAMYRTKDSVDKVSTWYKEQLSTKTEFKEQAAPSGQGGNQGGGTVYTFKSGSTTKMVMIREDSSSKGGTDILISDSPQGMPANPQVFLKTPQALT